MNAYAFERRSDLSQSEWSLYTGSRIVISWGDRYLEAASLSLPPSSPTNLPRRIDGILEQGVKRRTGSAVVRCLWIRWSWGCRTERHRAEVLVGLVVLIHRTVNYNKAGSDEFVRFETPSWVMDMECFANLIISFGIYVSVLCHKISAHYSKLLILVTD